MGMLRQRGSRVMLMVRRLSRRRRIRSIGRFNRAFIFTYIYLHTAYSRHLDIFASAVIPVWTGYWLGYTHTEHTDLITYGS